MDFMFEDEVDEVGSDVEAYCPKCKADTTHVVISKYEDEIRRVQCNPCGDVHSFRKPRGETEDDVPEPVAAEKRALLKKPGWDEFFARRKPERRQAVRVPRALPGERHRAPPQVRGRLRLRGGLGQQGGDHLPGRAAHPGAQPPGHPRAAPGGRGRRRADPGTGQGPRARRPRKAAAEAAKASRAGAADKARQGGRGRGRQGGKAAAKAADPRRRRRCPTAKSTAKVDLKPRAPRRRAQGREAGAQAAGQGRRRSRRPSPPRPRPGPPSRRPPSPPPRSPRPSRPAKKKAGKKR